MGENEIIIKLHQGDNAAFEELFDRYYHPLTFTASKLLRQYNEPTDDYVLFAFAQLFEHRVKVQTMAHVQAFLFLTLTNKCKNFFRDKRRTLIVHADYLQLSDRYYDPESPGFNKQQAFIEIEKGINQLPGQARQVAELYYVDGVPIKQIAKNLNMKPESVRQSNYRSLKQLRRTVNIAEIS